ncbi:MAG: hypothetical protein JWM28_2345 [Chitinophagaceae bacterium]|nr:hypothetical protein [Chitinophagaceae bacterium]
MRVDFQSSDFLHQIRCGLGQMKITVFNNLLFVYALTPVTVLQQATITGSYCNNI